MQEKTLVFSCIFKTLTENYYNIDLILLKTDNKKQALKSLSNAIRILQELEKQTGYHYPLIEKIQKQISSLK
jgi:hypothetical protein